MFTLLDSKGQPIAQKEIRDEAKKTLQEYFHKNHAKLQKWFQENGRYDANGNINRPPVYYDTKIHAWFWKE